MKNTYHVYLLRRISVVNYFILFFSILIAAGFLLNYFVKDTNLSIIIFIVVLLLDAMLGYYLSLANAGKRVEVIEEDGFITINAADAPTEKMPLTDITEYEVTTRAIAPKTILVLRLRDERGLRFFDRLPWGSRSGDFRAMCTFFTSLSGEKIEQ